MRPELLGENVSEIRVVTLIVFVFSVSYLVACTGDKTPSGKSESPSAATEEPMKIPQTIGVWKGPEKPLTCDSESIFDYMDGAGELYVSYRFKELDVYEFKTEAEGEDELLVEIYKMETSDDAFGLLSGDWLGDSMGLGRWEPDEKHALYDSGLLRIWTGDIYARVMAYRETEASKTAVLEIGKIIAKTGGDELPPALFLTLPDTVDNPGNPYNLRRGHSTFLRSHFVLNDRYFLSMQNILDFDHSVDAVVASYAQANAEPGQAVSLLLIRYATPEAAQKGLNHFREAYLPESAADAKDREVLEIENGFTGYCRNGRDLILAFECPEQDIADAFLDAGLSEIQSLD